MANQFDILVASPCFRGNSRMVFLETFVNVPSPVILEGNWISETAKFFPQDKFRAKAFTVPDFLADKDINTIWIVRETHLRLESEFYKTITHPHVLSRVEILTTFADEAHLPWRTFTSIRSNLFRKITAYSKFNVLISGTAFPLGPESDANVVLQHLGGPFDGGKWEEPLGKAFSRLVSGDKPRQWNALAFRIMIAPFYLRRTEKSTWYGKWVIERCVARPIPTLLIPYPDDFSEKWALAKVKRKKKGHLNLNELMERADRQRFFAWTPIYEAIQEAIYERRGDEKQKIMEEIISSELPNNVLTGRLRRFAALLQEIVVKKKERFVIVSDRLFLLTMAYYVGPCFFFELMSDLQ
jgi:hypothetical protein